MKTSRRLLFAAGAFAALTGLATAACAQASASASTDASVVVFAKTSVVKETDLLFGRIIRPSTGSTVYTINETTGAASAAGGDGAFAAGGGTPGRATFTAYGTGDTTFTISTDSTVVAGGVTINLVKSAAGGTLGPGTTGSATFGVGGNVTLTNAATPGSYSGSFNVTVNYP